MYRVQHIKKIGISIDPSIKNQIDRLDISDLKPIPKNNKLLIGVAPFAAHKGKEYPILQMEEVIKEINKTKLEKAILSMTSDEKCLKKSFLKKMEEMKILVFYLILVKNHIFPKIQYNTCNV